MCTLTANIQRATQARSPLQIVTTADIFGNAEAIINFLRESGHMLEIWNPVLGARKSEVNDGTNINFSDWDDGYGGEPTPILQEWISDAHNPDLKEVWRVREVSETEPPKYICRSASEGPLTGYINPRKVQRTLILVGMETWVDKSSQFFDPLVEQTVWELSTQVPLKQLNVILILPTGVKLNDKLLNVAEVIEDKLPARADLTDLWQNFCVSVPPDYLVKCKIPTATRSSSDAAEAFATKVVDRLCGLSYPVANQTLRPSIIDAALSTVEDPSEIFLAKLAAAKAEAIRKSSALEVGKSLTMSEIGGLEELKSWVEDSKVTFTTEAREAGISPAKGVLLVGPPGTGKSVSAKALAGHLGFPLIMFDMGSVYGSLVGDSERNMRNALATLEAAAPCVVLIDEFEKGMAGSRGNSTDGGTSQRVYGTLLTWMQERDTTNPVVVVATANDITKLDEAILRKGRFDEIFWVDLPTPLERLEILRVHLRKIKDSQLCPELSVEVHHNNTPRNLLNIVNECEGFVGAEISQAIKEAHIKAFKNGEHLKTDHIISALKRTKPLSYTMKESM